jgi:hypothetical protein
VYQKTSVNKVSFKLKNKGTFFSDILWSEQYWPSYSVFVETGVQTLCLEQSYSIQLFIPASVCVYLPKPSGDLLWCFHWDSWSTHFAWNSYTAIYSSLCTLVHGQTCRWLTLAKSAGGLRVPIFWFNVADYEQSLGIFVENCGAHTLLGTVKRLCIPAPVHCTLVVYLANCLLFKLHCTTTWRQPGLSRGFVDTFRKIWEGQIDR